MDMETGAAGYMISGGTAGGATGLDVWTKGATIAAVIWATVDTIGMSGVIDVATEAEELFAELGANGIKFTREATQWICRIPSGN